VPRDGARSTREALDATKALSAQERPNARRRHRPRRAPAAAARDARQGGVDKRNPLVLPTLWLHDGRAGSLREAIVGHGEDQPPAVGSPERSEAQEARDAFNALAKEDQEALLTFLRSLRTFSLRK
jgi:hypothetical protein